MNREYKSGFKDELVYFREKLTLANRWNRVYRDNLKFFDEYCQRKYPAETINQQMINEWCTKRETETNNSHNTRILGIREFVKYLQVHGFPDLLLPENLKSEGRKYIPHLFATEELKRFFHECDKIEKSESNNRIPTKIRAITIPVFFKLLYSTGMRTTEARFLKIQDVDLKEGVVNIRKSKGYDQHYVALHESTIKMLSEYNEKIKMYQPNREYFFESPVNGYYSKQWVYESFKKYWKKANEGVYARPYDLRHNYAIENINRWEGKSFDITEKLNILSKSMGHKNTNATVYYYSLCPALADLLIDKTEKSMNEITQEIDYENF